MVAKRRSKVLLVLAGLALLAGLIVGEPAMNRPQSSFLGGEVSPLLVHRPDLPVADAGLRESENALTVDVGMVTRRPGTIYVQSVETAGTPAVAATYKYTYISENTTVWGIPIHDTTMASFDVGGVARNAGGGYVGLPWVGHPFSPGDIIRITGTTNYGGNRLVRSGTTANEIQILATYVAETFDGTEVAVKVIGNIYQGYGRSVQDSNGNLYLGTNYDNSNATAITKVEADGTRVYDAFVWPAYINSYYTTMAMAMTPNDRYLYVLMIGTGSGGYVMKFDVSDGSLLWSNNQTNLGYDLALDADGNAYVCHFTGNMMKFAAADGAETSLTLMGLKKNNAILQSIRNAVVVDDDLGIVVGGGRGYTSTSSGASIISLMYNLSVRTLDDSAGDQVRVGGTYTSEGNTWTYSVGTGCVAVRGGYIYVLLRGVTPSRIYKYQWNGSSLTAIADWEGPRYGRGLYFDLYGNLVVVNQTQDLHVDDILYFYDTAGNSLGHISGMHTEMLLLWDSVGYMHGNATFWGELGSDAIPSSAPASANAVRLEPFIYSEEDAYVLCFGHKSLSFLRGTGQVLNDDGTAYALATPYDGNDLFTLAFHHSADVMYITSTTGRYSPRKLQRNLRVSAEQ
jgi:hypothetical protein